MSSSIYQYIDNEIQTQIYPKDIIFLIMKFIGFIINSNILNIDEQTNLYILMKQQHSTNNILSPLTMYSNHYICNFSLIFYASCNSKTYSLYDVPTRLTKCCKNKRNLVIVFDTIYNHKFALYLNKSMMETDEYVKIISVFIYYVHSLNI